MRRFLLLSFFVLCFCFTSGAEARKLALLIGVDDYDSVPSLECCVNDMKTLKEALMKIGFEEDDIQMLVTGARVFSNLPTKRKIEQRISKLLSEAQSTDVVFIALSGHGAQDGKKVYFCPPDMEIDDLEGTCVSINKIMDDLANCKAKFKWMVVDACRNDPNPGPKGIGGKGLRVIPAPPAGIALFQSCGEGEESWEDSDSGNGFFTKNFAAALSGEADSDHDGNLTLMEVCKWTTAKTKEQVKISKDKSQRPYFSGSVSDFTLTENLNVPKARKLVEEARKAMDDEDYELAIEKFDEALALCPTFEPWKRERNYAKRLLDTTPPKTTSRSSFEWDGTKITKFIGKETRVVIPEGTTEIGEDAFQDCSFLTSVVIPKGVTKIESSAFRYCKSLSSVVIPEGVTEIGSCAFGDCASLKSVEIPDSVCEIRDRAFEKCRSLTSIVIPEGVTVINQCMFEWCISLKSIVIPHSVRRIRNAAFAYCSKLKEWGISSAHPYLKSDGPGLLTKDGKTLIACPGAETEYRIPEGVISIEALAFANCSSLRSVDIPDSVRSIDDGAFRNCSSLTTVVFPKGVTSIAWWVFEGCKSLTSFVIPDGVTCIGISAFENCSSLKSIVIPESVTTIERDAFCDCHSLASVVIPDGVTKIGSHTFANCTSLTSIAIPAGVSEIGYCAFYGCNSLTSVIIPEGVSKIEDSVFEGCSSLKSVAIPNSVKDIEGSAFSYCPALKQWLISSNHDYFKSDGTGLLTKDGKKLIACLGSAKEYGIPRSVSTIGDSAFEGCSFLTSVVIPESVKIIERNAFRDCSSLTSIVIPEGITKIGWNAFMNCSSLTYFVIPENVTQLEQCMFEGCASLTSVVIPDSVKEIDGSAFVNCSSLKEWLISPSHPYFKTDGTGLLTKDGKELIACMGSAKEYRIPEGVTTIRYGSFVGCTSLTSIFIPESVKDVNVGAFVNCPALKKWSISSFNPYFKSIGIALLTKDGKTLVACPGSEGIYRIPEGVSNIGYNAFRNCSSLSSVVIPESVTVIMDNAFLNCSSLKSLVIPKDVKKIRRDAFSGCTSLATIIIPEGVIEIDPQSNCPNLTIYAPAGSEAENFAKKNNIPFQAR